MTIPDSNGAFPVELPGAAGPGRAVFDSLTDVVQIYDDAWRCVYLNAAARVWLQALALDPDALLGHCIWDALPDGRQHPTFAAARQARHEQREVTIEVTVPQLDAVYESRLLPLGDGVISLSRDITARTRRDDTLARQNARLAVEIRERQRSEDALRLLAEASILLSRSLDVEATLTTLVDLAIAHAGDYAISYMIAEDGTTRRVAAAHRNPARQPVLNALLQLPPIRAQDGDITAAAMARGETILVEVDAQMQRRLAGSGRHAQLLEELQPAAFILAPLIVRDRVIGCVLTAAARDARGSFQPSDLNLLRELSARAALAVDNARLFQQANSASEAKSQFLATISHELRTPLTAIIGYGDLLLDRIWGPLTPRQGQQLERIRSSAWHLVTIIDQILTFSRMEAGREPIRIEDTDAVGLARGMVELLEPQAAAKQLSLTMADPPQASLRLRTDAGKLRQILLNLLGNAVKFTEHGTVVVSVEPVPDELRIHVRDTGPGIPAEALERVFEPFTQLDQSNTRNQGGSGLGLTVSRRLARLLGGDVTVRSKVGAGSTFTIRMPREGEPAR